MRRRFKSGTGYPVTTAARDTAPNRGPDKPDDMRKAKRVRFADTEIDGDPVCASSGGCRVTQSPISGAAKTSEYAYFRKLKNGAVHGQSHVLHKENKQLNCSKVGYHNREANSASDMLNPSRKDFNFSVRGERTEPSEYNIFFSPGVSKSDEPDQIRSKDLASKTKKRSLLLSENVTPVRHSLLSPQLNEASENSENECSGKGIFSVKRDRLRQWAAQTSLTDIEKLHATGSDLVSSLMIRLFPKVNKNNDSSEGDADNSCKSLTFHDSNNLEKRLHISQNWDKDLPKICSGKSREIVLPEKDNFISGFLPPNNGTESHDGDKLMDLDQRSMNCVLWNSKAERDFSSLPFKRYRSSGLFRFKELDEFGSITELPREEEPRSLLLEWDIDRLDSSPIYHEAANDTYSRLASSWNVVDQVQSVDSVPHTREFRSSSLFSNNYLQFDSLTHHGSTSCLTSILEPDSDDVECAISDSKQFSLSLPCTPRCITLEEDRNEENLIFDSDIIFSHRDRFSLSLPYAPRCITLEEDRNEEKLIFDSDIISSHRDQHWLENKIWNDRSESKYLSAAEFSVGDPPPSIFKAWQFSHNSNSLFPLSRQKEDSADPFYPLSEGAFNHNCLSSNLQFSPGTRINCPLLLNHVSQDRSDQEFYLDNDGYDSELAFR